MTRQFFLLILSAVITGSCSDSSYNTSKQTMHIISANREAPLGWVRFDAFSDSSFEYSLSSRKIYKGTFNLIGDTLFLNCTDSTIGIDTAIIEKNVMRFYGKHSPHYAGITINKLFK